MQKFTSKATSINSRKLPAIYNKANLTGTVFDYGCGRYTDHIRAEVAKNYGIYFPYDPFWQSAQVNEKSLRVAINTLKSGRPLNVVCSNVLNVIDDDETVRKICRRIEYLAQKSNGRGYITVYEGDKSGVGRQTGPDQYQRNEPLRNYLRWFSNAQISNGMIVIGGQERC